MITVAIADDQTLIRATLATTLGLEDDLEVVAQEVAPWPPRWP